MKALALRTLKFRKTSFIATFVAMLLGAAIVMACGGLMETGIRMTAEPQRLGQAPLVVTGQQMYDSGAASERTRIDSALVDSVAAVPGVDRAVPDVSFPASPLHEGTPVVDGEVFAGHNWSSAALTPYRLTAGAAPKGTGEVVLDEGLADRVEASVGEQVQLAVGGGTRSYTVSGIVTQEGDSNRNPALFLSDRHATDLAGDGRIDSIGVIPAEGTDAAALGTDVRAAVDGRAEVLVGEERGLAEAPGALVSKRTVIILAAIFGSWAILVVMFGVASTLSLSLQQRAQEMALLRAIGTTPGQLRKMIMWETSVLSVAATLIAIVPGYYLGQALFGILTDSGVLASEIVFRVGWIPSLVGAVTAVVAAVGATYFAGRKAAAIEPVAALAETSLDGRWFSATRLVLALLFLAIGISLAVTTVTVMENGPTLASTAGPASVFFSIGIALLAPGICKAAVRVLRRPISRFTGISGDMALRNSLGNSVRMAGAAAPIVMLIAIATGTLYMQSTEDRVSADSYAKGISADYVLTSTAGGFDRATVRDVGALPGVAGATGMVSSEGYVLNGGDSTAIGLRGVTGTAAGQSLAVEAVTGSLDELTGQTVALSQAQAEKFGVAEGEKLAVRLGDGFRTELTVVAVLADRDGQDFLLLPAETLAPHTSEGLPGQLLVRAETDADAAAVRSELTEHAAALPGVDVADSSTMKGQNDEIQQILATANYTIVAMIVGYAAITVINTLVVVTRKRSKEIGLQRLTGATKAQVVRMLGTEGALIAIVATILGTIAAAVTLVPYSLVKSESYLPSGSILIFLAIIGGSLLLIFGGTLLPSLRSMRTPPIETVATE